MASFTCGSSPCDAGDSCVALFASRSAQRDLAEPPLGRETGPARGAGLGVLCWCVCLVGVLPPVRFRFALGLPRVTCWHAVPLPHAHMYDRETLMGTAADEIKCISRHILWVSHLR